MLNRQIHRQYRAIVCGKTEKEGIIDAPIGRAEDSTVLRRIDFEHGETARTRYRLLSYDEEKDLSYISLKLDTGRTHQIRVHMSYIGHPLPGDFLYNPDYRYISRQPLHSYGLEFIHPLTGEPLSFTAWRRFMSVTDTVLRLTMPTGRTLPPTGWSFPDFRLTEGLWR